MTTLSSSHCLELWQALAEMRMYLTSEQTMVTLYTVRTGGQGRLRDATIGDAAVNEPSI